MNHRSESERQDFSEPNYIRYLRAAASILRTPHLTLQQEIWAESVSTDEESLVERAADEHVAYEAALMVARNYEESGDPMPDSLQRFCMAVATGQHAKPSRPGGRPRNSVRDRIIANAVYKAAHEEATVNKDGSITQRQSRATYANGNQPVNPTACDLVAKALKDVVADGKNIGGVALSAKQVQDIWIKSDLKKAEK